MFLGNSIQFASVPEYMRAICIVYVTLTISNMVLAEINDDEHPFPPSAHSKLISSLIYYDLHLDRKGAYLHAPVNSKITTSRFLSCARQRPI